MNEAVIKSGTAKTAAGTWLVGRAQPAAFFGTAKVSGLRGFIVPDRAAVRVVTCSGEAFFASSNHPFLTRLDALPDEPLKLVSSKLLVAPFAARSGARSVKLIPFAFKRALPVTEFKGGENVSGWAVVATESRTTRVTLEEGGTLTVRPDAVVAWTGKDPTGFCPKLSVLDMILPRGPKDLAFTFHGPATVWFEGAELQTRGRRASA